MNSARLADQLRHFFLQQQRCIPDVAFDADPDTGVNVYFNGSSFGELQDGGL